MSLKENDIYEETIAEARMNAQDMEKEQLKHEDDLIECPTCGHIKKSNPTPDGDEICPSCWEILN
jgi:rubrerythrin